MAPVYTSEENKKGEHEEITIFFWQALSLGLVWARSAFQKLYQKNLTTLSRSNINIRHRQMPPILKSLVVSGTD